jgi:hypothetical protein
MPIYSSLQRDGYCGTTYRPFTRAAAGEVAWRWLALAFGAYWTLFIFGAYSGRQELNDVGAVFILVALGWAIMERLWVRVDAIAIASFAAALIPLLVPFVSNAELYPGALVKHVSLYLVMALARLLRLPVASGSKVRGVMVAQILIILVLSMTTDRSGVWDGGTRHSGLFANPNNLALIPFLLLFFVDRGRDPIALQIVAHTIVIAVLVWTGTSGAVMAYAIGLGVHFFALMPRTWRVPAVTLLSACLLAAAGFVVYGGGSLLPETRLSNQLSVMRVELGTVLSGGEVPYYEHERELGPGAASGIWRLVHWRRTITTYAGGSLAEKVIGFGIGSSPAYLGKLPHNEYLRVLFEQGALGLTLFLFAWNRIIRTAPRDVRYIGLILAIYSFSENNLDNFPFMALFILCLSTIDPVPSAIETGALRRPLTYSMAL